MTIEEQERLAKLEDFAKLVAKAVLNESSLDIDFEKDADVWAELFCRKLRMLGYVEAQGDEWALSDNAAQRPQNAL